MSFYRLYLAPARLTANEALEVLVFHPYRPPSIVFFSPFLKRSPALQDYYSFFVRVVVAWHRNSNTNKTRRSDSTFTC